MAEDSKPTVISPPNTLRAKVGKAQPSAEDLQAVHRAEAAIASLATEYVDVVDGDLANLQAAADGLVSEPQNREAHLKRIFAIAHDMKGQGGSFGYPLITTIESYTLMANFYYDFGNFRGFIPYAGAGIGLVTVTRPFFTTR